MLNKNHYIRGNVLKSEAPITFLNLDNKMNIKDYIKKNHGTQRKFAEFANTSPQHVTYWIRNNFVVIEGKLYKEVRDFSEGEES